MLGFGILVGGANSAPSATWYNSSTINVAVADSSDNNTEDYFSKLDVATLAAWSARGVTTSVSQTINPGNPSCANFSSGVGSPDILSFIPPL